MVRRPPMISTKEEATLQLLSGIEPYMLKPEESRNLGGIMRLHPENVPWQEFLVPHNLQFRCVS